MMNTHLAQIMNERVNKIPGIGQKFFSNPGLGPKFSLCSVSTSRPVLNSGESPIYYFGTLQALASLKSLTLYS